MQLFGQVSVVSQIEALLTGLGMPKSSQSSAVNGMFYADLRGIDSDGIALFPTYHQWLQEGSVNVSGLPSVVSTTGSAITIDGGGDFGFLGAYLASLEATKLAKQTGVAAVTVSHSHHFGAAGFYPYQIASAGLMAFVKTSTKVVCFVPPGARDPVLNTNPLAYGVPRPGSTLIVFDIATSTAAGNRIQVLKFQNKPVPKGWIVDSLHATDPVDSDRPVMLPREIEQHDMFERNSVGIPIVGPLINQTSQLAKSLGVASILAM